MAASAKLAGAFQNKVNSNGFNVNFILETAQQVSDYRLLGAYCSDSSYIFVPTSLCSYSLMLHAKGKSNFVLNYIYCKTGYIRNMIYTCFFVCDMVREFIILANI